MKKHLIFCFFLSLIVTPITSEAQNIPFSSRSREAISKVAHKIHQELSKVDLDWGAPKFVRLVKAGAKALVGHVRKCELLMEST